MVRSKSSNSKKPKRGVDFKKIKHKIGRKLLPPKNSTNTEIKSKAIVLPEQSISVERRGMVVDKRGLTLQELLKKTSHRNPKMRRDALNGIKEIILKDPSKLKPQVVSMMEKLNQLIHDNDGAVRDTFFNLLRIVIFPALKGGIPGDMIPLLMDRSLHAMTHLSVDIRLMAFKFLQLVIHNHPISFFHHAERVLDNYVHILKDKQICLQDKSKLKSALGGLVHCLNLLASETIELKRKAPDWMTRMFVKFENQQGFFPVVKKLEDLVPVLVNCFRESASFHVTTDSCDQSFEYMLSTLQCINRASRILGYVIKKYQHDDSQIYCFKCYNPDLLRSNILLHLPKLQTIFPFGQNHKSSEKEEARFFVLNVRVAEMFLHLKEMIDDGSFIPDHFVEFIGFSLLRKVGASRSDEPLRKAFMERHIASLLPFMPGLISQITGSYQTQLLEAFTSAFKDCKVNCKQILEYFSVLEEMILPDKVDKLRLETNCPYLMDYQIAWVKEFPRILFQLDNLHPSISEVALKVLNRYVQFARPNTPLMLEVETLQLTLKEFYDVRTIAGTVHHGPFVKLPYDCQILALCIIKNYLKLDKEFVDALTRCCIYGDLNPQLLLNIIGDLQGSYNTGIVQIADLLSFSLALIARFHVYPENIFWGEKDRKVSNSSLYKKVLCKILDFLPFQMRHGPHVGPVILQELWNVIIDEFSKKPPLENAWGLLATIIKLDRHTTRISDENIRELSKQISGYMVDAAFFMPEDIDVAIQSDEIKILGKDIWPCFLLLCESHKLLHFVFEFLDSIIMEWSSSFPSRFDSKYTLEPSARVRAIGYIFVCMCLLNDARLLRNLQLSKLDIGNILHNIRQLLDSNRSDVTFEEKHKIQKTFDQLKTRLCEMQCYDASELEGD
ncbi:uncharacterized protein [Typha angustifolia]|uniref:uncharacterized protein isoform X1 n=1 Tax=Typha angustifolia TaxID=59011 RepID=UPI003C2BDCFE